MVQQNDRPLRAVPFVTSDDVSATRFVFEDIALQSLLVKDCFEELCRFDLVAGRVGGVDAQVLSHQIDSKILIRGPVDLVAPRLRRSKDWTNQNEQDYGAE